MGEKVITPNVFVIKLILYLVPLKKKKKVIEII